jgi:hypothetical protein
MLDLDKNLKNVIILIVDGYGNFLKPIKGLRVSCKKSDEISLKNCVEKYLYSLMELKSKMAIEFLEEVE